VSFAVREDGGWLCGPWRRPHNNSSHEAGSIHDDATARALGFRSGTVAGSIHMEQFLPLLEHRFGIEWQRAGSLSLCFRQASVDREAVCARVAMHADGDGRVAVAMHTEAGLLVLDGTASARLDDAGAVRQWQRRMAPGIAPRILAEINVGFASPPLPTRVPSADIDRRLADITEPRPEFSAASHDGGRVAPLSAAVHAMRVFETQLPIATRGFVGLFGAIEWQYLDGPVFADRDYQVQGRVLAIGDSPRTEMLWTETRLHDPARGVDVARMLMLSRLLKATSPLWAPFPDPNP
jgi:hypothetical protein